MSVISWAEDDSTRCARWHSENDSAPPKRIVVADDRMTADTAYKLACEGTGLLWRGDYHNARNLLNAMGRRIDRKPRPNGSDPAECFHLHRRARRHRALVLGRVLVELDRDHALALRRAPAVRQACTEAYGPPQDSRVVALTELLGLIGAHEWRTRGVEVPALGARIHPHYGVFSPVRGEYVDLVAQAELPDPLPRTAFDLGTGTGVLAAVLAGRGVDRIVGTDNNPRALICARDNIRRLGLTDRIRVTGPALYPPGRADLVVCNPPWLPTRPTSAVETGVYDQNSVMLRGFLAGLAEHLEPRGEGWLLLSDLAERLGLRGADDVPALIAEAGLEVLDKTGTNPRHPRARDTTDPLHTARAAEVTSLWRLTPRT
ncbi:methyltransferase [Nocardia sp. NPDC127526]|uniref:methyltransferase n=1 Tax=Nocardia sp. NPDC127526 TaxID=3345393 RepID=UPI0036415419